MIGLQPKSEQASPKIEKQPLTLSHKEFLEKILTQSSHENMMMIKDILVDGKTRVGNITPEDGRFIQDHILSFNTVARWCITVAQVPRLRELVEEGLLLPQEAVAVLRAFEDHFFRYIPLSPEEKPIDWGPNFATRRSIPAAIKGEEGRKWVLPEEIVKLVNTVANNPQALFRGEFSR